MNQVHVQYDRDCLVPIRHIISASKNVQQKQVDHQVLVQGNTTEKYFPMSTSLFLLIYQAKKVNSLRQAAKVN